MFRDACVYFILTFVFYLEQNGGFFTLFFPVVIHDRSFAQDVERTAGHNSNVLSHRRLRQEILSGKNNSAALSTLIDLKNARRINPAPSGLPGGNSFDTDVAVMIC